MNPQTQTIIYKTPHRKLMIE